MKKLPLILAACLILLGISGCGYTTRSAIKSEFSTIYITPFVNKIDMTQEAYGGSRYRIYRPTVETDVTKATLNRFLMDGNLKPVNEAGADLTLKGELVEFRKDPLRYDDSDVVTEYRINIVVNLILVNNKGGKEVWRENNFTGDTTYFVTGTQSKSEPQAINDSIADLARRIVERAVEQW